MRLQWAEIRARAARFSEEHAGDRYEKGETQSFYEEFFGVFGIQRRQVAVYERRVEALDGGRRGFIDLFWPGTLIVEQKSAGRDLVAATSQMLDYQDWLPDAEKPRYTLVSDFQRFHLVDLDERREWRFPLSELRHNVEAFGFMLGVQPKLHRNQSPANEKASRLMGRLHMALAETGYAGHDLERLLVRLLFILFADDTGIFAARDQFHILLETRTAADGSDLGRWLGELFETLNTPVAARQRNLDGDLAAFPYINGRLFAERIRMPAFDNAMRGMLLDACLFNWGEVSPAIFGALFESVIDAVTQRARGAHYTPEDAILKVIGPLFLDDLRAEFQKLKSRRDGGRARALRDFHARLAGLTFLDPACGAGNFLVIAYRELRELERELLWEIESNRVTDVSLLSRLNVDAFHGIEIDEFPAQIAQVALWMTDHIANTRLAEDFGQSWARIPLVTAPNIRHADALEMEWEELLPAERCSYVLGNPPFAGQSYQSEVQRQQMRDLLESFGARAGSLDYVSAWLLNAARYSAAGGARIGLVSTNSICQGEQVAQLWPLLFNAGMEIAFAHRSFVWPSRAGVHTIVIGLASAGSAPDQKRLFSYAEGRGAPVETRHGALNAYLVDARPAERRDVVREASSPISPGAPVMRMGSKIVDGGHYIFNATERAALWDFAVLTSRMHMAWLRHIGGRLKSDYRYSIGLVYNSFPWPEASAAQRAKVERLAQAVLDARVASPHATLADLYDPDTMPPALRRAHAALDAAVDRLYRQAAFDSDRARVEHLFQRYRLLV